jgi:HK97 family phage major capsid protein
MPTATDTRPTPTELRSTLLENADKLGELRGKKKEDRGDTWASDMREAVNLIHVLDAELQALERSAEPPEVPKGPGAAMVQVREGQMLTPGGVYTEHEDYKDRRGPYRGGNLPEIPCNNLISFRHAMPDDMEYRALIQETPTDAGLWMPRGTPLPPRPREARLFVRDLLSTVNTTLASVPYIRELNPATNETGASSVAEGIAKPEVTMAFVGDDAPMRKIAAWVPVTSEIVDDAPTLRGYIDTRLAYMLALREEREILNGNGISPDLRGLRQFTGLQTQAAVSGDFAATIGRAMGLIENVDGEPDGIAMNPVDYWLMMTTRHTTQLDGGFSPGLPYMQAPGTIFGMTAIRTRSMEATKALVGSFRLGATLFDRQQTVIKVGDQHSDWLVLNKLVILAEERVGLANHRPDFFVEATLTP